MLDELLDKIQFVLAYYSLFIVIVGTIFNTLSFLICIRIRNNNTFIFLAFLSISDIFCLYYWNLHHFLNTIFDIDWKANTQFQCKIGSFLQYSFLQISAWLLVINQFISLFNFLKNFSFNTVLALIII
jgi:hypothetical protein